jgi:exosortase
MSTAAKDLPLKLEKPAPVKLVMILLPYLVAIVAQLPLLLPYFSSLWMRPHYQFFPIALLMVAAFAWIRWPRKEADPVFASQFSAILFWIAIGFGLLGTVFAEGWFSAVSMSLLLTSLFARTRDGEFPNRSLIAVALPLFVIISLPNNLDFRLITWLQLVSSQLSSAYLDLLGFRHYAPGTTLNFPDQSYEVERACSGVQSFFTLVFCATFIIVSFRRGVIRGIVLILSATFWAILMNSVRIMIIPIAQSLFQLDLKEGLPHELLGYGVMLFACAMLLSTDQLIEYLFGRRDIDSLGTTRSRFSFLRFGKDNDEVVRQPVTPLFRKSLLAGAVLMLVFGAFQLSDVVRSLRHPEYRVRFFDSNQIIDVAADCLPTTIESTADGKNYEWRSIRHEREDRTRGSDLGQRSDLWTFVSRTGMAAQISLDQPFPGWHELTTCYKNVGWQIASMRRKFSEPITMENGETAEWTYVEVGLENTDSLQHGWLMFCFCDRNGEPVEAPIEWDGLRSFIERAKNRLSYRIRSNLFRGQSYQMQVFVPSLKPLNEEQKEEVRNQFFEIRKMLRSALLKYRETDAS